MLRSLVMDESSEGNEMYVCVCVCVSGWGVSAMRLCKEDYVCSLSTYSGRTTNLSLRDKTPVC
jgi:hypothetical protein